MYTANLLKFALLKFRAHCEKDLVHLYHDKNQSNVFRIIAVETTILKTSQMVVFENTYFIKLIKIIGSKPAVEMFVDHFPNVKGKRDDTKTSTAPVQCKTRPQYLSVHRDSQVKT